MQQSLYYITPYLVATNLFRRCLPTAYRGENSHFGGFFAHFQQPITAQKSMFPSEKRGFGIN